MSFDNPVTNLVGGILNITETALGVADQGVRGAGKLLGVNIPPAPATNANQGNNQQSNISDEVQKTEAALQQLAQDALYLMGGGQPGQAAPSEADIKRREMEDRLDQTRREITEDIVKKMP